MGAEGTALACAAAACTQQPFVSNKRERMKACLREEQTIGEDNVCKDACADDDGALRDGSILQQVWVVWRELALGIIVWERHIASQGYQSKRILDLLALAVRGMLSSPTACYPVRGIVSCPAAAAKDSLSRENHCK